MITLPCGKNNVARLNIYQLLSKRRSNRYFQDGEVSLQKISSILWSAQGLINNNTQRTSPSAGALYPFYIYLVAGNISSLNKYLYKYDPYYHSLNIFSKKDSRYIFSNKAISKVMKNKSSGIILLTFDKEKIFKEYGEKDGLRYIHIEAGHIAQNILLMSAELNLCSVPVGAFDYTSVKELIPSNEDPAYIITLGTHPP